jgi:hypothetical protein
MIFSALDTRGNQPIGAWTSLRSTEEVVCGFHMERLTARGKIFLYLLPLTDWHFYEFNLEVTDGIEVFGNDLAVNVNLFAPSIARKRKHPIQSSRFHIGRRLLSKPT